MKKITFCAFLLSSLFSFSQEKGEMVRKYVQQHPEKFGVNQTDLQDLKLMSVGDSKAAGLDFYYYSQQKDGIEILNALATVAVKNGEVIHSTGNLIKNVSNKSAQNKRAVLSIDTAFDAVAKDLGIANAKQIVSRQTANTLTFKVEETNVTSKLVYVPNSNGALDLVWLYELYSPVDNDLYGYQVSAVDGKILQKENLTLKCNFGNHNHGNVRPERGVSFEERMLKMQPMVVENSAYNVVPFTTESPLHGNRQLLVSPANETASPYGWHNTLDGNTSATAGLKYTNTRGNNVIAYEDRDGDNLTVGAFANGEANLVFDFPYAGGSTLTPEDHVNASITNLFYMNNMMHDVMYKYGFDEKNGNFQRNNYGRGEKTATDQTGDAGQGDYVIAEAQDGGGTQNANFSTQADGAFGSRMQMYLWNTGAQAPNFIVNNTVEAGSYLAADNSFTAGHVDYPKFPNSMTGDLVLYDDGAPDTNDACTAAINAAALNGKIALIKRGTCSFVIKVKNAQNAGAIGVVIYDNAVGALAGMTGSDATITIPAVRIQKELGDRLAAQLVNGPVNVSIQDPRVAMYDGDFDNGIIAHEYGHGVSTRLAGGRLTTSCLRNSEQQGEGWSDFFAYMLTMKASDSPTVGRGIGNFASGLAIDGPGIRKYKYSTDMAVNPFTFESTNTMTYKNATNADQIDIHSVGSVWATMLWDLAWKYIDKYGFDADVVNGNGGNNKVMQLVIDGLKLQPCNASFTQARDAIIAADQATTGGQNKCMIWNVFARRGLGLSANSGTNAFGSNSSTGQTLTDYINGIKDQVNGFDVPADCILSNEEFGDFGSRTTVYPIPSSDQVTISVPAYVGAVNVKLVDVNGRTVYTKEIVDFDSKANVDIADLAKGIYILKLKGSDLDYTQKIVKN